MVHKLQRVCPRDVYRGPTYLVKLRQMFCRRNTINNIIIDSDNFQKLPIFETLQYQTMPQNVHFITLETSDKDVSIALLGTSQKLCPI